METSKGVAVVVLGIMQDAGLPHAGCRCARCIAAFAEPARAGRAASLALIDSREMPARVWLIDATPDIKWQLDYLAEILGPHPHRANRLRQPDGIFLTHGHMGHINGLPQFGPEAMAAGDLPIYSSRTLADVIRGSAVWQPVVANLVWRELVAGEAVLVAPSLAITPMAVPHRDEWEAGTFAYRIEGPSRSLLYVPDIDRWELWPAARTAVAEVDVALVDATFFSTDEFGGRPPVVHPLVPDTLVYFGADASKLGLIHLNHTNPVLDEDSAERAFVVRSGAAVAYQGQVFEL